MDGAWTMRVIYRSAFDLIRARLLMEERGDETLSFYGSMLDTHGPRVLETVDAFAAKFPFDALCEMVADDEPAAMLMDVDAPEEVHTFLSDLEDAL